MDRQKLKGWADQLVSKGEFPRLVRQLILETTPGIVSLGMPAGDGVAAGGWDGSVRAVNGNAWVPQGYSVWELSVDGSPGVKADNDYEKRHSTPGGTPPRQTTYVEAILRPWTARDDWAATRTAEGTWQSVRALGLDDIETWLQSAAVTWAWVSREMGLNPHGLRAGLTWWTTWSSQTSPELTPDVVLAGRNAAVTSLLGAGGGTLTVAGASLDDVCAFVAAAAVNQDAKGDGQFLARLAFVDDRTTWRGLLEAQQPLVLVVADPDFATEVLPDCAHTVIVPVTAGGPHVDIELDSLDAKGVSEALRAAGLESQDRADELGRLARRSQTALRRRLAKKPALVQPAWAAPSITRAVRAMLMLGSWSDASKGDRAIAEDLSGLTYEELREQCVALAAGDDPFLTGVGNEWHLVSDMDAWMLLSASLTADDLKRLEPAVAKVIGEIDPALDLPEDSRWWRASIEGKKREYSSALFKGLSETLALLAVFGERASVEGVTGSEWAAYLVRQLLEAANGDESGHGWQSLTPMLPLLAEAAPDQFTKALANTLAQPDSLLAKLFTDQSATDSFFAGSPHTHLLWALETLAWSGDYFGGAIDLLARLDQLDPGGRYSNRPAKSLTDIFCPWQPENSVSVERRVAVIDVMRKRYPDTTWRLLKSLLPTLHGVHFPTASPHYRDWKPAHVRVTNAEWHDFTIAVLTRMLDDAGTSHERWTALVDGYSDLPPHGREMLRDSIASLHTSGSMDATGAIKLWEQMQKLIGDHREFATAQWALPEEDLTQLEAVAAGFAPTSATEVHAHLFDGWTPHLGALSRRADHAAYEEALQERRDEAAGEIVREGGVEAATTLARSVQLPGAVGYAVAAADPSLDYEVFTLLATDDRARSQFAFAYFQRRFQASGWQWANELLATQAAAAPEQRATLLLATRDHPAAWEKAAEDDAVHDEFWRHFNYAGLGGEFADVEIVARALMGVGRHGDALQFLGIYSRREVLDSELEATLIAEGLESLLQDQDQIRSSGLRDHDFNELVTRLEANVAFLGTDRVASLEWAFLGALGHEPVVPTLSRALATDPDFFALMISSVYRAADDADEQRTPEQEQQRARMARNAHDLLRAWNEPPGLTDGVMDAESLRSWTDGMVANLETTGRAGHGLRNLGEVLVRTPPDADGVWPGEVVRDFLEERQSDEIESGLYLAIVNGRGVTTRGLEEGGERERDLKAKYETDAVKISDVAPRAAAVLRGVARSYDRDARRNDLSAERFRKGLE
ncbi:hypothetical protein [Kribbella sp. NPDC049227]|uniref:hypothetical protein n=1 Tax=Kribbella sp. NPDC049227 TaxID=3364113 RepID=UPI00371F546F